MGYSKRRIKGETYVEQVGGGRGRCAEEASSEWRLVQNETGPKFPERAAHVKVLRQAGAGLTGDYGKGTLEHREGGLSRGQMIPDSEVALESFKQRGDVVRSPF